MRGEQLEIGVVEERARVRRALPLMDGVNAELNAEFRQRMLRASEIGDADEDVIDIHAARYRVSERGGRASQKQAEPMTQNTVAIRNAAR